MEISKIQKLQITVLLITQFKVGMEQKYKQAKELSIMLIGETLKLHNQTQQQINNTHKLLICLDYLLNLYYLLIFS